MLLTVVKNSSQTQDHRSSFVCCSVHTSQWFWWWHESFLTWSVYLLFLQWLCGLEDDQPCTFVLPDSWCRLCVIIIIRWQITWLDLGVGEPPQGMFARPCQVELVCFRRLRLKGVVGVRVNRVGRLLDYKSMSTICANLWLRGLCQDSLLLSRWLLLRNNR
jgi:hypothetical protein